MPARTQTDIPSQSGAARSVPLGEAGPFGPEFDCLEFHRHGVVLVPKRSDEAPGIAVLLRGGDGPDVRTCTCTRARKRTCDHIVELAGLCKSLIARLGTATVQKDFEATLWFRIATILANGEKESLESVRLERVGNGQEGAVRVVASDGRELLRYLSVDAAAGRFVERMQVSGNLNVVRSRGDLLRQLGLLTLSDQERFLHQQGFRSKRTQFEESFLYRWAYHCYREFSAGEGAFRPAIDRLSGAFTVMYERAEDSPVFRLAIPRTKVASLLDLLKDNLPNQHGLPIHAVPLKSLFRVTMNTELDLEVRPVLKVIQESGEAKFLEREDLERFRYGNLMYIEELGVLAELEAPGRLERKFKAPVKMVLKQSQVPSFLDQFAEELEDEAHLVDPGGKKLRIFRDFDRIEITPDAIERDWCWLSVEYGFGNVSVSLGEILQARKEGRRYLGTSDGWIDCSAPRFDALDDLHTRVSRDVPSRESQALRLSRMDLFRLQATGSESLLVKGDDERSAILQRILDLKPATEIGPLNGMTTPLRHYQELGFNWLRFLFENDLGGLLCDDMGLGKTHQVMALMVALKEHHGITDPMLVVCPTTVLSHWIGKIRGHAPGLSAGVFHGGQRNLTDLLRCHDLIVTSYGIMRNDVNQLKEIAFSMVVFDEIQHLKNPSTQAHEAAQELLSLVKLGLTGTPIENRLIDLKALFDLTVPGYLGSDELFQSRYVKPEEFGPDESARAELSRLVSPLVLRRLKKSVLHELPEKIEDIRTCTLSDDQVKMYRDAISSRGIGLADILQKEEEPIPYIHIFALLNLLKQICNHPALVEGNVKDYRRYASGKWDLFQELVSECLDSGQKVVVFTQFLGMIEIMSDYLESSGVGFETLTGSSRNRGKIIARFNEDPDCRIFLGSLKAGGVGIDLVAGSVVIHYDRWWNAAREDQATDRVHRIGQTRGVQVFKLVTQGTLEEKISAIIEQKRNLMDSVVKEDDPGVLKTFSKEALIEMLGPPEGTGI